MRNSARNYASHSAPRRPLWHALGAQAGASECRVCGAVLGRGRCQELRLEERPDLRRLCLRERREPVLCLEPATARADQSVHFILLGRREVLGPTVHFPPPAFAISGHRENRTARLRSCHPIICLISDRQCQVGACLVMGFLVALWAPVMYTLDTILNAGNTKKSVFDQEPGWEDRQENNTVWKVLK